MLFFCIVISLAHCFLLPQINEHHTHTYIYICDRLLCWDNTPISHTTHTQNQHIVITISSLLSFIARSLSLPLRFSQIMMISCCTTPLSVCGMTSLFGLCATQHSSGSSSVKSSRWWPHDDDGAASRPNKSSPQHKNNRRSPLLHTHTHRVEKGPTHTHTPHGTAQQHNDTTLLSSSPITSHHRVVICQMRRTSATCYSFPCLFFSVW